jgi:hypothetical protein
MNLIKIKAENKKRIVFIVDQAIRLSLTGRHLQEVKNPKSTKCTDSSTKKKKKKKAASGDRN